jgi:uracil-DNA glycosylase
MSAHYERGRKRDVTFVLSAPGRIEEREGRPAAGATGDNLALLVACIRTGLPAFPSRGQFTVANAWPKVLHLAKHGRTEATRAEILRASNLARLAREIGGTRRLVVACGAKAQDAVAGLRDAGGLAPGCRVVCIPHLSRRGINRVALRRPPATGAERTRARLSVLARAVAAAFRSR